MLSSGLERDTDIECVINGEYSVGCRRDASRDDVFVPFSLVHKYFEVSGNIGLCSLLTKSDTSL